MKYSRNSATGELEAYTDDGQWVGNIQLMGDFVKTGKKFPQNISDKAKHLLMAIDQFSDDGGPGSGNWGHKGRPGQIGGSGKGGGKQYRGGRGDIMYTSSKHDWLNGLQGEKQKEAQDWLKARAESLNKGEDDKRSADKMVMESGSLEEKKHMLRLMQEARHWDKLAGRMISENLSDNDKALVTALAAKYGLEYKGGIMIPEETSMSDEDRACWYDLKSKAMYGVTSGQEAPDELQYAAGLKEKPKPKGVMWAGERVHMQLINQAERGYQQATGKYVSLYNVSTQEELEKIEKDMFEHLYESSNTYWVDRGIKQYLKAKTSQGLSDGLFSWGGLLQSDALNDEQKEKFRRLLQEQRLWGGDPIDQLDHLNPDERAEMFAALNKALGGADLVDFVKQKNQEKKEKEEEERKRQEEERLRREEERRQRLEKERKLQEEKERKEKEFAAEQKKKFTERKETRRAAIQNASTTSEVVGIMNDGGYFREGSTSQLTSVHPVCAREIARSYEAVCERFPFLIGTLGSLTENERRSSAYACCHTMEGGGVDVNPATFHDVENIKRDYASEVRTNWHPADTDWTSVVTHELGHAIDGFMSRKGILGSQSFSTIAQRFSGKLQQKVLRALKKKKADIGKEVCRYATKNHAEWFAECFAEAMHSPNPRPMATEMMRQLELIVKQEGLNNA